jgi:putative peptide zinc metalloprotease protein
MERMVREQPWLFVHNEITGQHVRLNALARQIVLRLDGVQSIDALVEKQAVDSTQEEKEALAVSLATLAQLGMIGLADQRSEKRLQHRAQQLEKQKKPFWSNPLAIRIPLIDPDRWLCVMVAHLQPLLNRWLLISIGMLLLSGLFVVGLNAAEIADEIRNFARTPGLWWQMLLVYPVLKCVHELAHAIVIKRFGGALHESGITILVLMPVPYVDATDIWRFEDRRQRILVSASGMLAEASLATVGLFVWLIVEPGLVSDLAFSAALTGSVTTFVFNANPLLRFDGYQILQDALDMPNLASRSSRYLGYLCRRFLLGASHARSPVTGRGERPWLVLYGVAAGAYRWIVTLAIALYLASRFPAFGGLLALFALFQLAIKPAVGAIRYLVWADELKANRFRAVASTGLCVVCLLSFVFMIPLPTYTRAEGVLDVPHQAQLYAPQSGELAEVFVKQGQLVKAGEPILRVNAWTLNTKATIAENELDILVMQLDEAQVNDPSSVPARKQEVIEASRRLSAINQSLGELVLRTSVDGIVSLDPHFSNIGVFIKEGTPLGHVVNSNALLVKAVVEQKDISRVDEGVNSVQIRLAERFWEPLTASLTQQAPAGNRNLPSQALAYNGASGIAVASSDSAELKTVDPVFQLEFALPAETQAVGIGGRAYVSLAHRPESIGERSWRALRRTLLDQLAL